MKTIVAGSRDITSYALVAEAIRASGFQITECVCGCAQGVDSIAADILDQSGIPIKRFSANWPKHGKTAGPIRNRQMAEYADALIAVWDGKSRGTWNMIEEAGKRGLPVYVHNAR